MKQGNESVGLYVIQGKKYSVVGCWDSDTKEGEYDFFDVFDEGGICVNLGEPFEAMPTRAEVAEYIKATN